MKDAIVDVHCRLPSTCMHETPIAISRLQLDLLRHQQMSQPVSYITSNALANILLAQQDLPAPQKKVVVIDVRDDDHDGGHIAQSLHIPAADFLVKVDNYVQEFAGSKDTVVFHCSLSQVRGPKCASRFAESLLEHSRNGTNSVENRHTPEVKVLEGGFMNFAKLYGDHSSLFADFNQKLHESDRVDN